ncbi:FHA domain-containing protein [Agreia pratensis]|uniref:FHA domain-containing protein n=1 Tax=Agreia pratensis TaxID=150121 RepID=UPI00188AF902|nr:FHA domain-containing protein [Agreia pratensis]MBF4636228.1 FHA domain-containing protein [Agreia pratensis]
MIEVALHDDGTGLIGLPGRSIPLAAGNIAAAREQAVRILTQHAAAQPLPLDVYARDAGETVHFTVHPDGRVIVDRPGAHGRTAEPLGPSLVPAPMTPPEAYVPAITPPPLPVAVVDVSAPTELESASDGGSVHPWTNLVEEVERTVVRPPAHGYSAVLNFVGQEPVTISGSALLGRRPVAELGEAIDQLIQIQDDSRSVSKTHLLAEWRGSTFWVADRNSSNGTRITSASASTTTILTPGIAHPVQSSDQIEIGDIRFTVDINTPAQK